MRLKEDSVLMACDEYQLTSLFLQFNLLFTQLKALACRLLNCFLRKVQFDWFASCLLIPCIYVAVWTSFFLPKDKLGFNEFARIDLLQRIQGTCIWVAQNLNRHFYSNA